MADIPPSSLCLYQPNFFIIFFLAIAAPLETEDEDEDIFHLITEVYTRSLCLLVHECVYAYEQGSCLGA